MTKRRLPVATFITKSANKSKVMKDLADPTTEKTFVSVKVSFLHYRIRPDSHKERYVYLLRKHVRIT